MIIYEPRSNKKNCIPPPDVLPEITRVEEFKVLGVQFPNNLDFVSHVEGIVSKCAQTHFGLGVLKRHGLYGEQLQLVANATLVARLTYASQALWGFVNANRKMRLQSIIRRAIRLGMLDC